MIAPMMTPMTWGVREFSKSQVNKAGKLIGIDSGTPEEIADARAKVSNFRSSHAYPLFSVTIHVRKNALAVSPSALVVRRMKRLPTILDKLKRHPNMNVTTMHDLGGTRAVLPTIRDVDMLVARLKGASRAQNRIVRVYDYLRDQPGPQATGYRGMHLVYSYEATKAEYHGSLIEVQIRTQLQHAWATAVETLDLFGGTRLKYNEGSADLKRYLLVASALMAVNEGLPVPEGASQQPHELRVELMELEAHLGLLHRLEGYVAAVMQFGGSKRNTFLLELHREQQQLFVSLYDNPASAEKRLAEIEAKDDDNVDAVLVSSKRVSDLRSAYPNYFADTSAFTNFVKQEILKLNEH